MITPFKALEEVIFPQVQRYVIEQLKEEYTQDMLASKMGITQAMVSKYIGTEGVISSAGKKIGDILILHIRADSDDGKIRKTISELGIRMITAGEICEECKEANNLTYCDVCMTINPSDNERKEILKNLEEATTFIERINPVELMPNVMMNIAMKTKNATTLNDVAAIPGRMVRVGMKIIASSKPQFGTSKHLGNILLSQQKFLAVTNIALNKKIRASLKRLDKKDYTLDEGAFGREPCAYIFGGDALDVSQKMEKIHGGLEDE